MALTTRLRLFKPTANDTIDPLADMAANYDLLDGSPGVYICTINTHPTWGANQAGMVIYELDSGLHWVWNGTAFVRMYPKGLLNNPATDRLVNDKTNSSTAYAIILQTTVTMPAGGRSVEVTCTANEFENSGDGLAQVLITRAPGAITLGEWYQYGKVGPTNGYDYANPFSVTVVDTPPAGPVTYQLQMRVVHSGITYVRASAASPTTITVKEV